MRRLGQPDLWFLVAVILLTGIGAVLLTRTDAVHPEARHLSYSRHYWQAGFDALSATCGVGLLTYAFGEDYTAQGRWILTVLGVLGAILFVAATTQAVRRMLPTDARGRPPHPLLVAAVFAAFQALALGGYLLARLLATGSNELVEDAWGAIAALSSLGWAGEPANGLGNWPLALLAWLGAWGWPIWLLVVPPLRKRFVRARAVLTVLGAYTLTLLLAALLISGFESPRGPMRRGAPGETLSAQSWPTRYARSLTQVAAASGAGVPTESLRERDASAGTKVTLALLLLVGGLAGSATGGVQWALLLWAFAGSAAALGGGGTSTQRADARNRMLAGLACVVLLGALVLVSALGLLLLENWSASSYQASPGFADALLDASSIVAGGNLSSGLIEAVTSRNLLSGIRQSANLYQYGMGWLMLAMLAGRMLPLVVLRRVGATRGTSSESSSGLSRADNK